MTNQFDRLTQLSPTLAQCLKDQEKDLQTLLEKEDGYLFHYTTAKGLRDILTSKVLWASHFDGLNDTTEARLLETRCRAAIEGELATQSPLLEDGTVKGRPLSYWRAVSLRDFAAGAFNEAMYPTNLYICSFAPNGDQLSQWRGYSGGTGYSLGFRPDLLARLARMRGFLLVKCIYDKGKQNAIAKELVNGIADKIASIQKEYWDQQVSMSSTNGSPPHEATKVYWESEQLSRVAAIFKDKGFDEEAEWRLLYVPVHDPVTGHSPQPGELDVHVRPKGRGLTEYVHFDFTGADTEMAHKPYRVPLRIFTGPGLGSRSDIEVVRRLMESTVAPLGIYGPVKPSTIPFRPT